MKVPSPLLDKVEPFKSKFLTRVTAICCLFEIEGFDSFEVTCVFQNAWFCVGCTDFDPLRFVASLFWCLSTLSRT